MKNNGTMGRGLKSLLSGFDGREEPPPREGTLPHKPLTLAEAAELHRMGILKITGEGRAQ